MTWGSASVPVTQLLIAIVILSGMIGLWFASRRWYVRWLRRRQWSRAHAAESEARAILEKQGYDVLGAQVEGSYSLVVDNRPMTISLRADYVVGRNGLRYVAEVKSGVFAPQLGTAATRRQLLEYLIAFQVDGVLLVDGETKQVHQVVFPVPSRTAGVSPVGRLMPYIAALILVATAVGLLCLH
jgi:hypothetical protein